jgi:cell division protein ZapE
MPHRILKVPERGMIDAYERLLAARISQADAAQRAAAERLQRLYYDLLSFKVGRRSTLRRSLRRRRCRVASISGAVSGAARAS